MMAREQLAISVVVPTCRRNDMLLRCLRALRAQDFPSELYEIVVVDDGHSDDTRALVAGFRRDYPQPVVHYLRTLPLRRGPAAARNTGWRFAVGEVIAFTDDDTIPAPGWLGAGCAAMGPQIAAAWGHVEVPLPAEPTDAERNIGGLHGAEFITANCFVRRNALVTIGGFDERFKRPWREDSDLYFSLLERRWQVVGAPQAVVVHPARTAPPGTCIRQHRNLFYEALLFKKHRRLYRQKIAAGPPLQYYLTVALLLVAAALMVGGWPWAALIAGLGWLGLTARLIRRRLHGISHAASQVAEIVWTSVFIPVVAVGWRLAGALRFGVAFA